MRRSSILLASSVSGCILLTFAVAAPAQAVGPIREFSVPTADSGPEGIAAGPDGALWFTEIHGNNIGAFRP